MFIFPMCGESSRFFSGGYTIPKYQLPLFGNTVFYSVINGFKNYFNKEKFLFIIRKDYYSTKEFIERELFKLSLYNYEIVELNRETKGQAVTVYKGLLSQPRILPSEWIIIFNIDTIRKNVLIPEDAMDSDGFLETVNVAGNNWSFVSPKNFCGKNYVSYTTEKVRISDHCSTGLYGFKNLEIFCDLYHRLPQTLGEYYISPMYNINHSRDGKRSYMWKYYEIDRENFIPCGTPGDYERLIGFN